jgi:hypothetical protein
MKRIKDTWDAWKYYLLIMAFLAIGPTQCVYDNYVKYKVVQAADRVAEGE